MDSIFLALRVVVSIGVVIGAIWFVQRRMGRGGRTKSVNGAKSKAKPISMVARQAVGAKASVAVVEFDGKRFLLGVTEHGVSVLNTADAVVEPAADAAFADALTEAAEGDALLAEAEEEPIVVPRALAPSRARTSYTDGTTVSARATIAARTAAPASSTTSSVRRTPLSANTGAQAYPAPPMVPASRLSGSVLSAATWKQALTALRGDR